MIDGLPLIDAHLHAARLPTLKLDWREWTGPFDRDGRFQGLYDEGGTIVPERLDRYLADEGVDVVLMMAEYSPKVTGIQSVEDLLPLTGYNPQRFGIIAALNPHYHHPVVGELERQLALGAVALKIHPVHGGFAPNDRALYPAYQRCAELGVPVVFHCGTSNFPGSTNRYGDPGYIDEVLKDVPELTVVLAHGGRGWWYDAAAFLALTYDNVWIEVSGLPPRRLPDYYAKYDFRRLARKCIFGSDWPGVPGIAANAQALCKLDLDEAVVRRILSGNALAVYRGLALPSS
jgi:uncharacterized protein